MNKAYSTSISLVSLLIYLFLNLVLQLQLAVHQIQRTTLSPELFHFAKNEQRDILYFVYMVFFCFDATVSMPESYTRNVTSDWVELMVDWIDIFRLHFPEITLQSIN